MWHTQSIITLVHRHTGLRWRQPHYGKCLRYNTFLQELEKENPTVTGPSPQRPIRSQTSPCGIRGEQSGIGTRFSPSSLLLFTPVNIIPPILRTHICLIYYQHYIILATYSIITQSTLLGWWARCNHFSHIPPSHEPETVKCLYLTQLYELYNHNKMTQNH
jgi:hypothetical protein